jgi:hypothetical protein
VVRPLRADEVIDIVIRVSCPLVAKTVVGADIAALLSL